MFILKNKIILTASAILVVVILAAYYVFIFETPDKCFVREMEEWSEKKGIAEKVEGITQKDTKMAVARAKAIMDEADYKDFDDGEVQEIYLSVKTFLDYCEVK